MLSAAQNLVAQILRLKADRQAVILAHHYQVPEVQAVADFVGDSLELSRKAAEAEAEVIVFCGVRFMAETAAILSPEKTVLLPSPEAGCPMANMLDAAGLRGLKAKHPKALVVCYVNSTAEVKAESDVCCTSANAEKVVRSLPMDREIIFVPDQYLGSFVASRTGRELVLWPGYCPTHLRITADNIRNQKAKHPDAVVLVHPECRQDVVQLADQVLSTSGMVRFVESSEARTFIIGTEIGLIPKLVHEHPDKQFIPANQHATCPNMKQTTLEKVLWSLQDLKEVVTVDAVILRKAKASLDRMLAIQ